MSGDLTGLCLYILSFDVNKQLMLALHETCEVKQRACPYLHGRLVSKTRPNKMVVQQMYI